MNSSARWTVHSDALSLVDLLSFYRARLRGWRTIRRSCGPRLAAGGASVRDDHVAARRFRGEHGPGRSWLGVA